MASETEGQPSFLENLKLKYEELMLDLEEKGIPSPRLIVPIILVLIILVAAYLSFPSVVKRSQPLTLQVKNAQGNPLPAMTVFLYDGDTPLGSERTDSSGKVTFKDVPANANLKVKVTDPNAIYSEISKSISFSTSELALSEVEGAGKQDQLFVVWVYDSSSFYIAGASVKLVLDDGKILEAASDFQGAATFLLTEIPDHVTLKVSAKDFKDAGEGLLKSQLQAGSYTVSLQSQADLKNDEKKGEGTDEPKYGKILVSLSSASDSQLEGIQIVLKDAVSFRVAKTARTDASGRVLLENVLIGKEYALEIKESAKYLGANSESFTLSSFGDTLEIPVELKEKLEGDFIDLQVFAGSVPKSDAIVFLFDLNGKQLQRGFTDDDGKITFLVSAGKEYYLTAFAENYAPTSITTESSPATQAIQLQKMDEGNAIELNVQVSEQGEAVELAEVALFKADGFFLGIPPAYADMDGVATFKIPLEQDGAPYKLFARAVKDAGRGESARIISTSQEQLEVNLVGEPGKLEVEALDAIRKTLLQKGSISAVDESGAILANCEISQGKCALQLPADTQFSLTAISENYLQTTSESMALSASEFRKVRLHLVSEQDAGSVKVSFLGFYNSLGEVKELGNAERYFAKFLVTFPSAAEISGFHLHLSAPGNFIEIESIDSPSQSLFTSPKFSPDNCYANADNGTIISFDLLFPKGTTGSREVAAAISVKPSAPASSSFALNYKAYTYKNGVMLSDPAAEELKAGESLSAMKVVQKMCAQKNTVRQVQLTSAPLVCNSDASFCRKILLDKSREVELGQEFSLQFEILSREGVDSVSLYGENLKLVGATAGSSFADESEVQEQTAAISIPANVKTPGSLKLKALKAGTTVLQLSFNSESRRFSFQQNLKISGENVLKVSVSPLQLLVGEEKRIRVAIRDGQDLPVKDALITLYDCGRSPLDAQELQLQGNDEKNAGLEGLYSVSVTPQGTGRIGVKVEHPQYRTFNECLLAAEANDETLTISPSSLLFKGDSSKQEEKTVTIASSLGVKSTLSIISNCGNDKSPVLYAFPNAITNFKDSSSVQIGVIANSSATITCNLIFEQRLSQKESISKSIPVRIDIQSPTAIEIGDPQLPPLSTTVTLELDENGFADKFFSSNQFGEVSFCDIKAAEDFLVTAECTKSIVHLAADYSGQKITNAFRQKGKLQIRTSDQFLRTFTIVVVAPHAPPEANGTNPGTTYYNNLPPLPNPITIQLDPYTRRSEFMYSLGVFGEPVIGCSLQDLDYGISTEFCTPQEQRVRVVADFSGFDTYNRLLQRIYGGNPACYGYYEQFGYLPGSAPYDNQQNVPRNYYNDYSRINQYGNGNYPLPEYSNGLYNYNNYPSMMQQQPPYQYPAPPNYYGNLQSNLYLSGSVSAGYADPLYSASNCNSGFIEGSLLLRMQSGLQQRVPIRIIAKGSQQSQQKPYAYAMKNAILSSQDIVLDPYTLTRYAYFESSTGSGFSQAANVLCSLEADPQFYAQLQGSLNYKAQQLSPLQKPAESGKFKGAISSLQCKEITNGVSYEFTADASRISLSKQNYGALNKEDELYFRISYPQSNVVQLLPILLKIGGAEFSKEPISNDLQFILTNTQTSISQDFKLQDDIFTEDACVVSGWEGGTATTDVLAGFKSLLQLEANFEKIKYKREGDRYVAAEKDDKETLSLPVTPAGTLSCKTRKGTVGAKLHIATFKEFNELSITNDEPGRKVVANIPFAGDIFKEYLCELSSNTYPAEFKKALESAPEENEIFGCKLDENGLKVFADYNLAFKNMENDHNRQLALKNEIIDTIAIKLTSITPGKTKQKEFDKIERDLVKLPGLKLKISTKGGIGVETFRFPTVPGAPISSGFACTDLVDGERRKTPHAGIDFAVDTGSPVYAAKDGIVQAAGCGDGGVDPTCSQPAAGIRVIIDHGEEQNGKCFSLYAHLKSVKVAERQKVNAGDLIGWSDKTGSETTGPHLHFEYFCETPEGFKAQNPCKSLYGTPPAECECQQKDQLSITVTEAPKTVTETALKCEELAKAHPDADSILIKLKKKNSDFVPDLVCVTPFNKEFKITAEPEKRFNIVLLTEGDRAGNLDLKLSLLDANSAEKASKEMKGFDQSAFIRIPAYEGELHLKVAAPQLPEGIYWQSGVTRGIFNVHGSELEPTGVQFKIWLWGKLKYALPEFLYANDYFRSREDTPITYVAEPVSLNFGSSLNPFGAKGDFICKEKVPLGLSWEGGCLGPATTLCYVGGVYPTKISVNGQLAKLVKSDQKVAFQGRCYNAEFAKTNQEQVFEANPGADFYFSYNDQCFVLRMQEQSIIYKKGTDNGLKLKISIKRLSTFNACESK